MMILVKEYVEERNCLLLKFLIVNILVLENLSVVRINSIFVIHNQRL